MEQNTKNIHSLQIGGIQVIIPGEDSKSSAHDPLIYTT